MVMTSVASDWTREHLEAIKGDSTLAVVIPALNEEGTIAQVVSVIAAELGEFVDELVVMDSLSSDRTAEVAANAGARVHSVADVRPDLGVHPGKGEALWKSQFVTSTDVIAFIDADLTEWGTHFVRGVVGPLLADPQVVLCRGFYDRVLDIDGDVTLEGGRVTELVARPWLTLFRPELGAIVQPLAGEWAIRRNVLEQLHVPIGYGVEFSTLLDVYDEWGIDSIAQVDLGRRAHRHQNIHDLSVMAVEILATAERRRARTVGPGVTDAFSADVQLARLLEHRQWSYRAVPVTERPPVSTLIGPAD
ncbi:MAG: glucosyl-3-phosphoglycerate synthase [Actinomycetales bacterium]|nr:glucosyl-3-phosphoglycerate synthase [Actinomycetales bacterium]MCP4893972.1 glucosyl-3-phosphoglycerate synthase [Actinomycetales bacterium]